MAFSVTLPNIGKHPIEFSCGQWAKQANGSVVITCGGTMVLVTVCMSKEPKPGVDFFPLTVEYQERTYAMGKIPGGYIKREGRPKDAEILSARLIDRPLRPLFPKGMSNEVQIVSMLLSSDGENDPDVLAVNAASCALMISDVPFETPAGAVRVAKVDGNFVINPSYQERDKSGMDFVIVGTEKEIVMLEGRFAESSEAEVQEAIKFAHTFIRELIKAQLELKAGNGKKKKDIPLYQLNQEIYKKIKTKVYGQMETIYTLTRKEERESAVSATLKALTEELKTENAEIVEADIKYAFFLLEEEFMREKILNQEKRPDGRSLNQVRPIDCKVGVLPRTHGSAVFTRGQTQALAITTLGTSGDEQIIEALEGEQSMHFILHYSFPPFSVGEVKRMSGPSRRDIGHGALAEKGLTPVIPSREEFPYAIREVSEILESNGSSSMATACATSLSLMDAGVPIKSPVAGIAIGLVKESGKYKILTDIAGIEDHYGDMDFKVTGTKNGVTAIQVDMKVEGIDYNIIADALARAKDARIFILGKMNEAISTHRAGVSQYAPKIKTVKLDPEKIGEIIGPGGRVIRKLQSDYKVTIDINEDGPVAIASVVAMDQKDLDRAVRHIEGLLKEVEPGEVYEGTITRLANFGAFCEILPGQSGLIHVSEISAEYVKNVEDFLKIGDLVKVKVVGIDQQGRINLSIKAALE